MPSSRILFALGALVLALVSSPGPLHAQPLTLPLDKRPEWLSRDGIVMAGSWEPLVFRVRRDGGSYTPTPTQRADYQREQSPEMVARLKALGVNFVMMHCYKGAGLDAERTSMADAVRFSRMCHDAGMRVGVYNYSGALLWEPLFKELPQAKEWTLLDSGGKPLTYGPATYRYYWNRNHPAAEAFYHDLVRFSIEEIRTDLVHLDNYVAGPGFDAESVARFRRYLKAGFSPRQLKEMGVGDAESARPPAAGSPVLLRRAWQDFCSRSLAESFWSVTRYARSLRPDVLMECNPGGVGAAIYPPVDHGRILQGGEAYWVESGRVGYSNGQLVSRIRNYKAGRALDNITFDYTLTPLEMAESMAFNFDCLGCICWFEYGKIVSMPGETAPISPSLEPYIRFFHQRRDLLRGARVVADAAVLRSFPSQAFGGPKCAQLTARVEDLLAGRRGSFQIIYDHHQLGELGRYRALVLAGCPALGDEQVDQIRRFVAGGGRLCVMGPLATHDQWMMPRDKPALDDLPAASVVRAAEKDDWMQAIQRACGPTPCLSVETKSPQAGQGLCAEVTDQASRRLVHLVNYRSDGPVMDAAITLRLPAGRHAQCVTLASPQRQADLSLPFTEGDGTVRFTVPAIRVYEIAGVEWKAVRCGGCAVAPTRQLSPAPVKPVGR